MICGRRDAVVLQHGGRKDEKEREGGTKRAIVIERVKTSNVCEHNMERQITFALPYPCVLRALISVA